VSGKLVIFTAPSGAGKTTLVRHLVSLMPDKLMFSVSATTRSKRQHERNNIDYCFITKEEFKQRVIDGDFLEWQEVYDGNYYGTLKSEIDRILQQGKNVIFDVDVEGATNIKHFYGDKALTVFVQPPSVEALRNRLIGRNTETNETLEQRVKKAILELEYAPKFDQTLVNDRLELAKQQAYQLVNDFLNNDDKKKAKLILDKFVATNQALLSTN
jgi:guanylate kinase